MPTSIQLAYAKPANAFPQDFSAVSAFLMIGLIQIVVAVLTGGQWASFGEPSLWSTASRDIPVVLLDFDV